MNEEIEQLATLIDDGTYAMHCDNNWIYWKYIKNCVLPYLRDRRRAIWSELKRKPNHEPTT